MVRAPGSGTHIPPRAGFETRRGLMPMVMACRKCLQKWCCSVVNVEIVIRVRIKIYYNTAGLAFSSNCRLLPSLAFSNSEICAFRNQNWLLTVKNRLWFLKLSCFSEASLRKNRKSRMKAKSLITLVIVIFPSLKIRFGLKIILILLETSNI